MGERDEGTLVWLDARRRWRGSCAKAPLIATPSSRSSGASWTRPPPLGVPCAPREFSADRAAPGHARDLLVDALWRLGHDGELLDDARLVVTELAANAVVHASSSFSVSIRDEGSRVRIVVGDRSPVAPAMREPSSTLSSGRGMRLVASLATRWGVDFTPDGKVVWAEPSAP